EEIEHFKKGDKPLEYPDTDWKKASIADYAPENKHSISVSGGTKNTQYYFSGDYLYQQGMLKSGEMKFKRTQLNARINTQILDNLNAELIVKGRRSDNPKPVRSSGVWSDINQTYPWLMD